MILVNCSNSTKNILVGNKYLTIGPGEQSINTMLNDKDVLAISMNYSPSDLKFKITIDAHERNQLASLEVSPDFIYQEPKELKPDKEE